MFVAPRALLAPIHALRQGAISVFCKVLSLVFSFFCRFQCVAKSSVVKNVLESTFHWETWKWSVRIEKRHIVLHGKTFLVVVSSSFVSVWRELITWPQPCTCTEGVILENVDPFFIMMVRVGDCSWCYFCVEPALILGRPGWYGRRVMLKNVDFFLLSMTMLTCVGDCSWLSLPGRPDQFARRDTALTKGLALSPL